MAKVEGLNLRGSRYYVRVVIPSDLKEAYGKDRLNLALGTSDRREATLRGTIKRAEVLAEFEANRKTLNPVRLAAITPELSKALSEGVRRKILQQDQDRRDGKDPVFSMLISLAMKTAPVIRAADGSILGWKRDPLEGLNCMENFGLSLLNSAGSKEAGHNYARMNRSSVLPFLQQDARAMGFTVDRNTPGIQEALSAYLVAYREAWKGAVQRDSGEVIETPVAPTFTPATRPAPEHPKTLRDVFDRWKLSGDKPRSKDSIAAYARAVAQFEGQHPGVTVKAINGDLGDLYRTWLVATCNTLKTARDRLTAIKSLLKYAADKLEWIPKHPWRGLDIKASTTNKRRPWSDDELQAFFRAPLYSHYALPESPYGGQDAAYWVPLLGLFTGARLGELCQLRTNDIQTIEDIPVLVLTDEGEGQSLKSEAGHRSIPIHSELLRLGFLDYVEAIRVSGSDSLWPAMRKREGKPSDFFGRWFREARRAQGIGGNLPDFHCLRHTVRTLMRLARISEQTQDKVTGHTTQGSIGTVVYSHWTLKEIREAVEAIKYPILNLPPASPHKTS